MQKFVLSLCLLLLGTGAQAIAQVEVSGRIVDAETGEPLPAAHIIIKDTYRGTISNQDGEYRLVVQELPATLLVRFLGFESQEKRIEQDAGPVDFLLKPAVASMGEIVVTGEDPAIAIMKEVIRRKQVWRASLNTYKAEAYTRQQLKNDTTIVSISESISIAYWDKEKGSREILKSKRQTANIDAADNFAGVSYLPNFYDDNLDVAGFDVVGVTHPKALSFYDFSLEDIRAIDGQVVYELKVIPKRKLQPLFEGTIYVLGEDYALLEVELKPNSVVVFPPPVQDFNLSYSQQFSNFGGEYWLPVDVRINGLIEIGLVGLRFPAIGFKQVAKLNDYEVNLSLPDTLFKEEERFSVDSTTIHSGDSLFVNEAEVIPLDAEEERAYETVDSTATLEKAFRPTGFLTRFIDFDDEEDENGSSVSVGSEGGAGAGTSKKGDSSVRKFLLNLSPLGRFNRVDEFYGGVKHERRYVDDRLSSRLFVGYSTGYEQLNFGAKIGWWPLKETRRFALFSEYKADTETRYQSELFSPSLSSVVSAWGYADYFDFYRREGIETGAAYRFRRFPGSLRLSYLFEEHSQLDQISNYDLAGRDQQNRPNSYIEEGSLSALKLIWSEVDDSKALGAIGANDFKFSIEQSATALGSNWNYTQFKLDFYRRIDTFYKRRFFPNTLDLRLNAGTYIGDLPIQKNGVLDVALGAFTPFGAFKSQRFLPFEGARYIALNAEHNFKSVPLELLGWRGATKTGLSIIAFGGIGRSWVKQEQIDQFNSRYGFAPNTAEDWYTEAGLSLSNIFNLFRVDVAYRFEDEGIFAGISIARFF